MASKWYVEFARGNAAGEIDLNADTFYVRLLLANTTAGSQQAGVNTVADITTLDEHAAAGNPVLANIAVNKDDPNLRAEFDADDVTFNALAADVSGRNVVGVLVCRQAGGAPALTDTPCCYLEYTTPKVPDGSNFTIQWSVEGIGHLTVTA